MEVLNVIAVITDVNKICRTCLNEKEDLELCCLFDNTLDNMLCKLTDFSTKPVLGDGLPSVMCKQCITNLNIALAFKELCQRSDMRLRNLLLISPLQKASITLKELLLTNLDVESSSLPSSIIKTSTTEAGVQTNIRLLRKRKKQKQNNHWSSLHWSSEDESFCQSSCNNTKHDTNNATESFKPSNQERSTDTNGIKKFKCDKCTKIFRSAAGLRIHSVKHGIKLSCEVCDKKFVLIKHLNKHMRLHKDYKPHTCKICKKSFGARANLSKHMRVHGGEKKYLCMTCGRRFFEPGHLAIHMRTHTGEKPIVCNVCGKRFADPHGLAAHNKIHTGERNYECKICGKRFAHSFVLTAHNRTHTGERPYECSICGASYATSSYLTIHKRTHTQEKPFTCESCPKAFVSRCALVAHNMTHTGEKKFQCNVCGKRVARAADLNIHMRSHTGERPYACDQCPKRYHTSSNLSAHKRTHTGIRNHVCVICDKAFGDARVLKGHLRIHTGEKPYVCQICGKQYSQSGQLAAHRKTHNQPENQTKSLTQSIITRSELSQHNSHSVIYHNTTENHDSNIIETNYISMNSNNEAKQMVEDKLTQDMETKNIYTASVNQVSYLKLGSCGIEASNFYSDDTVPLDLNTSADSLKISKLNDASLR